MTPCCHYPTPSSCADCDVFPCWGRDENDTRAAADVAQQIRDQDADGLREELAGAQRKIERYRVFVRNLCQSDIDPPVVDGIIQVIEEDVT